MKKVGRQQLLKFGKLRCDLSTRGKFNKEIQTQVVCFSKVSTFRIRRF